MILLHLVRLMSNNIWGVLPHELKPRHHSGTLFLPQKKRYEFQSLD